MTEPVGERNGRLAVVAGLAITALLAAGYALQFAGAVAASAACAAIGALAVWVLDVALYRFGDLRIIGALNTASAGVTWRAFIRQTLLLAFLLTSGVLDRVGFGVLLGAVLLHHLLLGLYLGLRTVVRVRRLRRLETRNLDVPGAELPPLLPDWLMVSGTQLLLRTDILLVLAVGWGAVNGSYSLVTPAAVAMVVLAAFVGLALVPQVLALRRLPSDDRRFAAVRQAVAKTKPRVILYFSGGAADIYQVNMWLETMQRLERPVLVLLRERRYLDDLAETSVPVLCLPFTADVMNLEMPSARVGLYVANVGRNIHLLREPGLKSAFIGHGDSDKTASFNPATKVYDEVWVAGQAGRDRYRRAQVGVRDEDVVLVGRPQLDAIESVGERPVGDPFTVLYAPTWEGWTDDPFQTSVTTMGPDLVRDLLATPGVRVVYRPHPLTGRVNRTTGEADERIVAAIEAAGAPHTVVRTGSVYDAFNDSDALVSDISSVVSDYLRSGKPYFVCNPGGLDPADFRERNASARAAYLISPTSLGHDVAEGVAAARGDDPLRADRVDTRAYLIGDPSLDSMSLFRDAVDALADKAEAQYGGHGLRSSQVDDDADETG